jgi:hypothetical protein
LQHLDNSAATAPATWSPARPGTVSFVSEGWSVIRVHRQPGFYRESLRRYQVRIDGSPVAKLAPGETRDFSVPAGEHRVRVTIDWLWTSREATLQLRDGERAEFSCRPGGPALWAPFALLWGLLTLPVPYRHIRLDGPF